MFSIEGSRNTSKGSAGMSKATIAELQFHLPTNQQRPAPPCPLASSLGSGQKRKEHSRPTTGSSAISDTYMRPWGWKANRRVGTPEPASSNPAPTFWVEEETRVEPKGKDDIEWQPPNDWDVVGPVGCDIVVPAVPMPAFLKPPPIPVDPRTIDPSSFPLPGRDSAAVLGRWSTSQASSMNGHRASSVTGDSMFCTCDLEDIQEEQSGSSIAREGGGRFSTSGSSIHTRQGKCRACMRRSAAANAPSAPPTPTTPGYSRNSSVRKPRRKRRQEVLPRTKIAVAGRLYQGE